MNRRIQSAWNLFCLGSLVITIAFFPSGATAQQTEEAVGQRQEPERVAAQGNEEERGESEVRPGNVTEAGDEHGKTKEAEEAEGKLPKEAEQEIPLQTTEFAVGDWTVENIGRWTASERKHGRDPELWHVYMHGVVDHFATPVLWTDLLGDEQEAETWLTAEENLDTPYKKSPLPALRLGPKTELLLGKPLNIDLTSHAGKTIRVFIWMRGEKVGNPGDSWAGPPGMEIVLKNASGKTVGLFESLHKTQGTFPWHGYYRDFWVPVVIEPIATPSAVKESADAAQDDEAKADPKKADEVKALLAAASEMPAGAFVRLVNKYGGTVWFSNLSWEVVGEANSYTHGERQDPSTGSLACNPRFDELPYHLRWGKAYRYPYRFLLGAKAGLQNQPYDVTTKEGFSTYYRRKAKKDLHHLCYAVSLLLDLYKHGTTVKRLPDIEDGWLESFRDVILQDQDPETGFWGYERFPQSMAVTWHFVEGFFGNARIVREDRQEMFAFEWRSFGVQEIPHAEKMVDTILKMQATYRGRDGRRMVAAWPLHRYHFDDGLEREGQHRCSLAATSNAIYLLRVAAGVVKVTERLKVEDAVRHAFRYVLDNCVRDDGLWTQNDTDGEVTYGAFLPRIIDSSPYLERRVSSRVARPDVVGAVVNEEVHMFRWNSPSPDVVSTRLYAVPAGTAEPDISEKFLIGIMQRTGQRILEMDPFVTVRRMRDAARLRWNLPWAEEAYPYTHWKLAQLREPVVVAESGEPISVNLVDIARARLATPEVTESGTPTGKTPAQRDDQGKPRGPGQDDPALDRRADASLPTQVAPFQGEFYATAVNWYGEESRPARVRMVALPESGLVPEPAKDADTADDGGETKEGQGAEDKKAGEDMTVE